MGSGMDNLAQSDIEINSCSLCQSASKCVSFWYIYCNSDDTIWDEKYDSYAVFDGESCRQYASHCQCGQNQDLLSNAFSTDLEAVECAEIMEFTSTQGPGPRTTSNNDGKIVGSDHNAMPS